MKKTLLLIIAILFAATGTKAVTIDQLCGIYLEHTTGSQALSFLCTQYNDVDITNIVIISKVSDTKVQLYGFYRSPNAIKATFYEDSQSLKFSAQKFGGADSYYNLNKAGTTYATIADENTIQFDGWTISAGSDLYSKDMKTTLTRLPEQWNVTANISAPGYYEGEGTIACYGDFYLLHEGNEGYTHAITLNSDGAVVFPWATVMYSTDDYCYNYNTLEDEDLLLLGNASPKSSLTITDGSGTLTTPFQYYKDQSDEQKTNPTPNAQGTYTVTFTILSDGITSLNPQPSSLNLNPSTLNHHPSTLNHKPSTINPHPYSLSGQRLASPQKGINIIGGKKYVK